VITVTLSGLRLGPEGSRNLPKAGGMPYLEFPILVTLPPLALPLNLSARSNGCLIFSQEKVIFFEQIQPLGVTSYPSISLNVGKSWSFFPEWHAVTGKEWRRR
jgi:hypothetical protein